LNPEFSPDGKHVAIERVIDNEHDIWILELARSIFTRFTTEQGIQRKPVWSPDGSQIVYAENNSRSLVVKSVTGAEKKETVYKGTLLNMFPADWYGKYILFEGNSTGPTNIWVLSLDDGKAHPLRESRFTETDSRFSPDGKWIVYTSNEDGRYEVWARSFPSNENKIRISTNGGVKPRWRRDGKEIFYIANDDKLMAVRVSGDTRLEPEKAEPLFQTTPFVGNSVNPAWRQPYDVTTEGNRFLIVSAIQGQNPPPLTIVLNWQTTAHR
jgi:Tol biopolymer transport system component